MAQITLNSSGVASSGSLLLQTNGTTTQATLDTSGNMGLGVTPSAVTLGPAFQIANGAVLQSLTGGYTELSNNAIYNSGFKYISSSTATLYEQGAGAHKWFNATSGTAGNAITFTQAMTLDASGNLSVGTTGVDGKLTLQESSAGLGAAFYSSSGNSAGVIGTTNEATTSNGLNINSFRSGGKIVFTVASAERARIDSSGNLLVGKTAINNTNTGITLDLGSTGVKVVNSASTSAADGFQMYSTGAGGYRFYVNFAGTIFATNTTISSLSDVRYKENIVDLDVGLNSIMALKPRKFDWKEGKGANIKNARGFIAQEFEEVFPDLIDEWRDAAPEGEEPYKSVRADLIPVLVKAIQEQQAIITQLQADVAALKG